MEVLKRLLGLEFIGWMLIALAAFDFSNSTSKWGVLFILISKICCALKFSCKWCSCGKGEKDCKLPCPRKKK